MNKGISFYFGFDNNFKLRAKMIKDAGFDCVIANADPRLDKQNGKFCKQMKQLRKNDLKPSSLHMRYKKVDLPNFFKNNKTGDQIEKNLIKDVKVASKYGFKCVVVHLAGKPSKIGIERINRILKICEKKNVPLAFENLNHEEAFHYVMQKFNHPYVKFCYDVGHNNVFHPEIDYLKLYGDKLICVHLHDNDGKKDLHTFNCFGTIDWKNIAKKLAKCPEVNLDYELMPQHKHDFDIKQTLQTCLKQATDLENMIKKEKSMLEKRKTNKN